MTSFPTRARWSSDQLIVAPGVDTTSWYSVPAVVALSSAKALPWPAGTPLKPVPQSSIRPAPSVVCHGGTDAAGSCTNVSGGTAGVSKPPSARDVPAPVQTAARAGRATERDTTDPNTRAAITGTSVVRCRIAQHLFTVRRRSRLGHRMVTRRMGPRQVTRERGTSLEAFGETWWHSAAGVKGGRWRPTRDRSTSRRARLGPVATAAARPPRVAPIDASLGPRR